MRLQEMSLVKVWPSIGQRIAKLHHKSLVRRLRYLRQRWERDMDGENWTALETRAVLILSDVCAALDLSESDRVEVLGAEGVLALAAELDTKVYPALNERQLTALSIAEKHGRVRLATYREPCAWTWPT
jgi:hypothetical protein